MRFVRASHWRAQSLSPIRRETMRPSSITSSQCGLIWSRPPEFGRSKRTWRVRSTTMLAGIAAVSAVIAITPPCAWAQSYPSRPITLVVPLPPGGTNDIMARAVADKLGASLGQQAVVENRAAGGSGTVGTRQAAKSAPDGYTLLLGYTSTLATGPSMHRDVGYDPRRDFAPIGLIASAPSLLLIHPSLQVRTVMELIRLLR